MDFSNNNLAATLLRTRSVENVYDLGAGMGGFFPTVVDLTGGGGGAARAFVPALGNGSPDGYCRADGISAGNTHFPSIIVLGPG